MGEVPKQPPEITKILIAITTGQGGGGTADYANFVTDMGVVHQGRNGAYNRAEQYVNTYLLSIGDSHYIWRGSKRGELSKVMEGHLKAVDPKNIDGTWEYSEELFSGRDRGQAAYRLNSICHVTWVRDYGNFDESGGDIIRPVTIPIIPAPEPAAREPEYKPPATPPKSDRKKDDSLVPVPVPE